MPQIDIRLTSQFDGKGFKLLEESVGHVTEKVSHLGMEIGLGVLGARSAAKLLESEFKHVIDRIDEIPGIPQETIDSVNRAHQAILETRVQVDQWIAKGITAFTQLGEGLGYFAGMMLYGKEAAVDAFTATQETANKAAEAEKNAAENARKFAEEQRAALKATEDLAKAFANLRSAFAKEDQVGETPGQKINRLRKSAADKVALTQSGTLSQTDSFNLSAEASKERAEAAALENQLNARALGIGAKQAEVEFEKLTPIQQINELTAETLRLNEELSTLNTNDPAQLEKALGIEERRLEIIKGIASATEREAAAKKEAGPTAPKYRRATLHERDEQDLGGMSDPSQHYQTPKEGAFGGIVGAMQEIGTMSDQIAAGIRDTIGGAFDGIAGSVQGLLRGTMTWGGALRNIGGSILNGVIGSISRMFAQWVTGKLMTFVLDKTLGAASAAAAIAIAAPTAMALTALWVGPATLASIATLGAADVAGVAGMSSALLTTRAMTLVPGYDVGGYTANGPRNRVAGVVHAGEWVAPQWLVNSPHYAPMIAGLEAARQGRSGFETGGFAAPSMSAMMTRPGYAPPRAGRGSSAASQSGGQDAPAINQNFAFFNDEPSAREWLRKTEGSKFIIDVVRRNRHEIT